MAGKHHHHIWQLLQRGFAEKRGKYHHIWVYKKDAEPRQTTTRKFGQDEFYYGPEGSIADQNITEFENDTQSYIQDARKAEDGAKLDPNLMGPIIAHLEMRSMFLRDQMSMIGERLVKTLRSHFQSEKQAYRIFSEYLKNHPEFLDEMLDENGVHGEDRMIAKAMAKHMLPNATTEIAKEFSKMSHLFFEPLIETMADAAMRGHIKALESSATSIVRAKNHQMLDYFVHRDDSARFIMPDTNLAFLSEKSSAPISQEKDKTEQVIFPISTTVMIIGMRKSSPVRNAETLNKILASCAYEAFIAKEDDAYYKKLTTRIGRNAKVIKDSEFKRMFSFDQILKL